jgi:V/A-type H+-transporting ATPase subunit B
MFGDAFEQQFLSQSLDENRSMEETLDLSWRLLSMLPKKELTRVDNELLEQYYRQEGDDAS